MTTPRHTRRRFLNHSLAACGAASAALSRAGKVAADEADTKEPLRGAVIGCGGIASHHARVNLTPHFKITAICDVDRQPIAIEVLDAVHPVDLVDGLPTLDNQYNTANSFRIRCRFPAGAELIICDHAQQLGFDNGILFECEQGRFFVNRGKLTGKPIKDLVSHPLDKALFDSLRNGRPVMPHMENFYRSCRERVAGISDPASHIRNLNVCHLANIALRLGRNLRWDPASRAVLDDQAASEWLTREQRNGFEVS
ncbi:hypothetical protein Mal15_29760 [Stieleria maiorica]|uniref:Gfo/Idh/MocA-like oxidoreductase bacterial type C-terminal domain-containing protein n=1 Tax=Stieleria maiorica TaxID=2795974 RepID=A0A5B9MCY0_9BACT|nr:hypothetical protein [Stieleria maiorica]QEF98918.1 hypothetical protein Mal15_29760 [Stieleria maiorica]